MRDMLATALLFTSITIFGLGVLLTLHFSARERRRIRQRVLAYRMTVLHQEEMLERMEQEKQDVLDAVQQGGRLIYNAKFFDYYTVAYEENPGLTERVVVHLYLYDNPLPSDFLGTNSGQLEEEA